MKMGRNHHYNIGVQQEINPSTVLEVNYVGNIGRYLNGTTNINIPAPGAGGVQARRPYPQFGGIAYFDTNMSNTYHSLQTTLVRRASRGLWYLAVLHLLQEHHDPEQPVRRRQRGTGEGDLRLRRSRTTWPSASAGSCPSGRGKRFLGDAGGVTQALLGGWQVQAIAIWRSGRPYTPTIGADRANTGVGGQRPNRIGSGELDDPTVDKWFDTAGVRPARPVHLRRLRSQHPARRQLQEPRLLGVQALRQEGRVPRGVSST